MLEATRDTETEVLLSTDTTQTFSHESSQVADQQFFNEMRHADGTAREEFIKIQQWLEDKSLGQIEQLNSTAKQHFIDEGITFTVYGNEGGTERIIPFDFIPRIIEKKQWEILDTGCKQRVKALNAFLHDVYHQQHILNSVSTKIIKNKSYFLL